jgi:hypothetical protein
MHEVHTNTLLACAAGEPVNPISLNPESCNATHELAKRNPKPLQWGPEGIISLLTFE